MSQQEDDLRALAKIMDMLRGVSIVLVVANIYWFSQNLVGMEIPPRNNESPRQPQRRRGLFNNIWNAKWWSLLLLALSCFGTKGLKNERIRWSHIWICLSVGAGLFFLNWWMPAKGWTFAYILTTAVGYIMMMVVKNTTMDDRFNNENESFMQETRLLENEYSVNLPTRFFFKRSGATAGSTW